MKKWSLLILFAIFVFAPVAYSSNKQEVIRFMSASEPGYYSIFVFWDKKVTDYQQLNSEMLDVLYDNKVVSATNISKYNFVNLHDTTHPYNYRALLDLKKSPTIVLLDHKGIILQTSNPKELLHVMLIEGGE